ncbi:MAG: hypothetical protein AAF138_05270 [Planctomycetota bacterium]
MSIASKRRNARSLRGALKMTPGAVACLCLLAAGVMASPTHAQPAEPGAAAPAATPGSAIDPSELAARQIARVALLDLRLRPAPTTGDFELASALLAVAQRFAPNDAELLRRRIEAAYSAGDDGAVVELSRQLVRLDPRDESALLRVIAANINKSQTVESRLGAYRNILESTTANLSDGLRSRLAVDAALLARELGNDAQFANLVSSAVRLDSTNKSAATLALNYFLQRRPDDLVGQAQLLFNLVLADPFDPLSHIRLYRIASATGAYNGAYRHHQAATSILQSSRGGVQEEIQDDGLVLTWRVAGPEAVAQGLTAQLTAEREAAQRLLENSEKLGLPLDDITRPEDTRLTFTRELTRLFAAHAAGDEELVQVSSVEYLAITQQAIRDLGELVREAEPEQRAELNRQGLMQLVERFAIQAVIGFGVEQLEAGLASLQQAGDLPPESLEVLRGLTLLSQGRDADAAAVFEANPQGLPGLRELGLLAAYVRAGRLEEAAELGLQIERANPLTVFGAWAWSQRQAALGGQALLDQDTLQLENLLAGWPRWLFELFEGTSRFLHLDVRPVTKAIDPLGSAVYRIELRNISTAPLAVGSDATINSKLLLTLGIDAGVGKIGEDPSPEVLHLDRRIRLMPRESIIVDVPSDAGYTGWLAETAADEVVRHRAQIIQGFRIGERSLYEPGAFSTLATSGTIMRLRLPETGLSPEQLRIRAAEAPPSRLPWVAAALRAGLYAAGDGMELTESQARPIIDEIVKRYPALDVETRAALLGIMPHAGQFASMAPFDEVAENDEDPGLRLVALVSRVRSVESPALGRAASDEDPLVARFALLLAERLEAGDIGYAGAGPEIDGLRTDARPER